MTWLFAAVLLAAPALANEPPTPSTTQPAQVQPDQQTLQENFARMQALMQQMRGTHGQQRYQLMQQHMALMQSQMQHMRSMMGYGGMGQGMQGNGGMGQGMQGNAGMGQGMMGGGRRGQSPNGASTNCAAVQQMMEQMLEQERMLLEQSKPKGD
jgi:hypothetical protein